MRKRILAAALCLIMAATCMVYAGAADVKTVEAPKNLTVEVKNDDTGYPYFTLKMDVPASVEALYSAGTEDGAEVFYEVEYKVGNGAWDSAGSVHFLLGPAIDMNPQDMGINGNVDIKANVYQFRVKFGYYPVAGEDEYGNMIAADTVYSPYSNIASTAISAYQGASSWAVAELDKADEYGFITDKIKDNMNQPITREELCEVIMKLYEKILGEANYSSTSIFTDTRNPQVYKAYELGIVNGVGNNKFAPNDLTNREQVAAMMYRAVKAINPSADFSTAGAEKFSDEKQISSWALEPVKFMNKNGFIKGSNGFVSPKGTTTREQAVLIVVRTYEKYAQ